MIDQRTSRMRSFLRVMAASFRTCSNCSSPSGMLVLIINQVPALLPLGQRVRSMQGIGEQQTSTASKYVHLPACIGQGYVKIIASPSTPTFAPFAKMSSSLCCFSCSRRRFKGMALALEPNQQNKGDVIFITSPLGKSFGGCFTS
jgi:hypothetical protein